MELTSLSVVANPTQEQEDQLSMLRGSMPDRLAQFTDRYLVHLNAAQAAAEVGAPGQERTLLSDRRVLLYISAWCGHQRQNNAQVRAQMVGMLAQMASHDLKGAISPLGVWLPFHEWPDALRMCVEGIELHESGAVKKVKLTRRLDVLKMLLDLTGSIGPTMKASHARVIFEEEG